MYRGSFFIEYIFWVLSIISLDNYAQLNVKYIMNIYTKTVLISDVLTDIFLYIKNKKIRRKTI